MEQLRSDDELVTGEAVALDLPAATVGLRMLSGLVDVALAAVLLFLLLFAGTFLLAGTDDALLGVAGVAAPVLVLLVLPTTVETLTRGRSVGKLVVGLRTVRDDAGPVSFRHSFVRSLVGVVEIWVLLGVPALLCALVSPRGKRLGDVAAGTYVVRDRFPFPGVRPSVMPPALAGWAATADMAPLPDRLALAVRQLLDRAPGMTPAARDALTAQLHAEVLTHVAPAPPSGHHPQAVLAAVLAERRRRDAARLARDEALLQRLRRAQTRR